jgi:hypothetical protein
VFGEVRYFTTSPTLGCGQAEHNWNWKDNQSGKRSNLSLEKAKKLSVISTATISVTHIMFKLNRLE